MSAEVQIQLVKKIITDWCNSDDCSGVDALIAIIEILNFDPYKKQRQPYKGAISQPCSACSAGDTAMEYHDHDYVDMKHRVASPAAQVGSGG